MNTEQILKVLKNERECIKRQVDMTKCKRHEHEGCLKCDLCLPDDEILEVYDYLIGVINLDVIEKRCKEKENPLSRKTFDGHRLGEIVVNVHGICKIVDVDGNAGYTAETIMPKEVFIEAYNKYVKGETEAEV